jgi:hypothetical protein
MILAICRLLTFEMAESDFISKGQNVFNTWKSLQKTPVSELFYTIVEDPFEY